MEDVKKALDESGLICTGTQDYYDDVMKSMDSVIKSNDLWGSKYICVSGIPERFRTPEGCLRMADEVNSTAARLRSCGKILQFHPVVTDYQIAAGRLLVDLLMENVSADVQVLLDIYHVYKSGLDPAARIRSLKGRIDHVHFKDSAISTEAAPQNTKLVPVGQGAINWAPVIRACLDTGVSYCFAEQEQWDRDPFECLRESYQFITGMIADQSI